MPRVSSPSCMMTPESDVDSPLAISSCVDGNNARVIIRHLLDRFGREEINRLLEEEAPSSSSQIGRITSLVQRQISCFHFISFCPFTRFLFKLYAATDQFLLKKDVYHYQTRLALTMSKETA